MQRLFKVGKLISSQKVIVIIIIVVVVDVDERVVAFAVVFDSVVIVAVGVLNDIVYDFFVVVVVIVTDVAVVAIIVEIAFIVIVVDVVDNVDFLHSFVTDFRSH